MVKEGSQNRWRKTKPALFRRRSTQTLSHLLSRPDYIGISTLMVLIELRTK